jgi:hypothetical protein
MFPLLIPAVIVGLGGGAWWAVAKRKSPMTPERKKVFEEALKSLKDVKKLRALADGFEKEGLKEEADLLRKRANLKDLPADQKSARKVAFRKALDSKNPDAIEKMAGAFHRQGATGSAARLRQHAAAVRKAA